MKKELIFKAIVGSQSYGTSTPTSDIDYKGVYMQSIDDLISFNYKEQIDETKDECYYEVRRFLQLLESANPTVLELLFSPEDCVIKTSPEFNLIVQNKDKFLTKKCLQSFGGYAAAQIKKAKGLDKKMNWEKDRIERKDILDFCYILLENEESVKIKNYFDVPDNKFVEFNHWGLAKINNFPDCYSMYYIKEGNAGIASKESNDVKLYSIPKGLKRKYILRFDKHSYSVHCKDFREYRDWLQKRNTQRYVDNKHHNQQIDGKNLMHCRRLLDMAIEIATNNTITIKRPNADYLLSIRKGEINLNEIIEQAEIDLKKLNELFANSTLPDDCDRKFVNDLLIQIRHLNRNNNE